MWESTVYITAARAAFAYNYTLLSINQKGTDPVDQSGNKTIGSELMDKFKMRHFIECLHEVHVEKL